MGAIARDKVIGVIGREVLRLEWRHRLRTDGDTKWRSVGEAKQQLGRVVTRRLLLWLAGLVVTVLAIVWFTGLSPFESGESVDDIEEAVDRYAELLGDGDPRSVDGMVGLTVNARQNGVTVPEAVAGEEGCLDWSRAQVRSIARPIAPFHADVVYWDGTMELTRVFTFEGGSRGSWHVTLDDPPCTNGVG